MLATSEIVTRAPLAKISAPKVAILMCTRNGATFLGNQLDSIAEQSHTNWALFVSDDGSTDETRDIIRSFADRHEQKTVVRNGPGKGARANFLSLATDTTIDADFFAFSDQDDVWPHEKISRAVAWLKTIPADVPALYCGRTELISDDGRSIGLSPLFMRPPSFQNALVQNLGGGNTMAFNKAAKRLLEKLGNLEVVLHDWWIYQLISLVGGAIRYDPQPVLKYRQHSDNLIGHNRGQRARLIRIWMMLNGRFRDWNSINVAALQRVPPHLVPPQNFAALRLFAEARVASLFNRIRYVRKSGVYRQTLLGNIGLAAATLLKRI